MRRMMKKTMALILFVSLMILGTSAAFASGKSGFFGLLALNEGADARLSVLAEVAEKVSASLTTQNGITVKVSEAYCEGNRVFVSYRIGANTDLIELYEGTPDAGIEWDHVLEDWIPAEIGPFGYPDVNKENRWLDGKGQRWLKAPYCSVMDGIDLEDGSYADIIAGDEVKLADGSVVGWKECIIPEENSQDPLSFRLALSCSTAIKFQDGSVFKEKNDGERTREYISFILNRNSCGIFLQGVSPAKAYEASAELAMGRIDLCGTVRLVSAEQAAGWTAFQEGAEDVGTDLIIGWYLYRNDQPISMDLNGTFHVSGMDEMVYELRFPLLEDTDNLLLVPEYTASGEHPDEAIRMEPVTQE